MKIVLDAMGGDHAPVVTVEGAVETVNEVDDIEVVLVGAEDLIWRELEDKRYPSQRITVVHASQTVSMDDEVSFALRRKKDSSIHKGIELVRDGKADAFVSAGHSGVVMATALLRLGKVPGVSRPAIAATLPTLKGKFILIDAGANVDSEPENLFQFALMGNAYAKARKPDQAVSAYREALLRNPELGKAWYNLGMIHIQEALKAFIDMGKYVSPTDPASRAAAAKRQALFLILQQNSPEK